MEKKKIHTMLSGMIQMHAYLENIPSNIKKDIDLFFERITDDGIYHGDGVPIVKLIGGLMEEAEGKGYEDGFEDGEKVADDLND